MLCLQIYVNILYFLICFLFTVRASLRAAIVEVAAVVEDPKAAKGGAKGAKGAKATPAPAVVAAPVVSADEGNDEGNDIKEDQVELMRDRKTLELESAQRKRRQECAGAVRARCVYNNIRLSF